MLINVLNSDNYLFVNISLAQVIGLDAAVYCSELLNIFKKATTKNKLIDNEYMKLDRRYIVNKTTLSIEDQLKIDLNLSKIKLLTKHADNPDIVKLDIQLLTSLTASEDVTLLEDIKKRVTVASPKGIKITQRQHIIAELKNSIECSNYELLIALRDWIDAIYSKPGGYLSKLAVKAFQDTLNEYTKGDLDLALRLVQIAGIQGYKDCNWAIAVYQKDQAIAKKQAAINATAVRVTKQINATKENLSDDIF